jgi:hemolysin activation/secretion protein
MALVRAMGGGIVLSLSASVALGAIQGEGGPPNPKAASSAQTDSARLFIKEYRVLGAHKLSRLEVEEAVYPFLGPGRTPEDVERARVALEDAYKAKAYQTVSVEIPPQQASSGIVTLRVVEAPVGRLRVKGSRFYSPRSIKREAPSLAEGTVPNFNAVSRDIVGLNQLPDRRVTPTLRAGGEPGTVDIDLNVTDTLPLHGSVELNNRYSPETTELRLNGSLNYQNLWDLGHSIGFSFQLAPERLDDAKVYSAYYLLRFPEVSWLSLIAQGTKQDSDVSTLGGAGVAGRGEVAGARAIFSLPLGKDFYHSLTAGFDYKHYTQNLTIAGNEILTPVTYYPLSLDYNATWTGKGSTTVFDGGVTFNLRGIGSDEAEFDFNRFKASGDFFYFRGDLSHTHELPEGWQFFGKLQGQLADGPLLSSEQFNAGGLATVRGYLESEVLGDDAIFGSIELRTPSLFPKSRGSNEWRFYLFGEGGWLNLQDVLPEQESQFTLASFGGGTRIRFQDHFNGSLDVGVPLISQTDTKMWDLLLTFRVWADF